MRICYFAFCPIAAAEDISTIFFIINIENASLGLETTKNDQNNQQCN
jgi:hypothetical protein